MKTWTLLAGLGLAAAAAHAGVVVQSGSTPLRSTDFLNEVALDQFDDMGGLRTLDAVEYEISAVMYGVAEVESLDSGPTTVMLNMTGDLDMTLGGVWLGTLGPSIQQTVELGAFDGEIDFLGDSGAVIGPLSDARVMTGSVGDVSAFLGDGSVLFTADVVGASWSTGSGNLVTGFTMEASYDYRVTYRFSEVPGPGSLALFGLSGLIAVGRGRRA
jgi:ABC-type proline/glycine betaine transport system substrate-binding protein